MPSPMIQVTVFDSKNYIMKFKNFVPSNIDEMLEFIRRELKTEINSKVEVRKWP